MTSREEAEHILSTLNENDLVEIDSRGNIHAIGEAPQATAGKPIAGITDQKGEYTDWLLWICD